ncbi:hypothetical protein CDL15_Pgr004055 [Punica granatum]|uniref:Uncharacterized protein n=1 Tax=Punica granatum TaxID=22663 RepID=A0A218XFX6_PUNGR|nr:hypothetical protein CDL15_Pgr004055 [Punica granatum]
MRECNGDQENDLRGSSAQNQNFSIMAFREVNRTGPVKSVMGSRKKAIRRMTYNILLD